MAGQPEIKPYEQVYVDAWRAALVSAGARQDPDMRAM
jgi:hypothetical protein